MIKIKVVLNDNSILETTSDNWSSSRPDINILNDTRNEFVQMGDLYLNKKNIAYIEEIKPEEEK